MRKEGGRGVGKWRIDHEEEGNNWDREVTSGMTGSLAASGVYSVLTLMPSLVALVEVRGSIYTWGSLSGTETGNFAGFLLGGMVGVNLAASAWVGLLEAGLAFIFGTLSMAGNG